MHKHLKKNETESYGIFCLTHEKGGGVNYSILILVKKIWFV